MPIFREEQYIRRHLFVLLLIGVSLGGVLLIARHRQAGGSLGLFFDVTMGLSVLFTVLLVVWFLKARLVTVVREDGLLIHFEWLWRPKEIAFDEIASVEPFTYRPLRDYGGWGIRRGQGEYMWNAYGNQAVRFRFHNGVTFALGSQQPEKLVAALQPYLSTPQPQ